MNLADLTLETAKPLEGLVFEVTLEDGRTTSMRLDEALAFERSARRRTRSAGPVPKREPFALYFLGSPDEVLPQAMYTFRNDLVTLENVFIVAVGRDTEATEYEAVFA
jgi:hypothetical protein